MRSAPDKRRRRFFRVVRSMYINILVFRIKPRFFFSNAT
jgi:hypothetical protein